MLHLGHFGCYLEYVLASDPIVLIVFVYLDTILC